MIKWKKLGHVFSPNGSIDWMDAYAQMPRPLLLDNKIRIYFSTRPAPDLIGKFVSRIGWIDVDKKNPTSIISISQTPALDLGPEGSFDEFGVMPGDISIDGDKIQLLYTGWERPKGLPYATSIGKITCSIYDSSFDRKNSTLLLGKTILEPYLCNGPALIKNNGIQYLFYASGTKWIEGVSGKESIYKIMRAKSLDGIKWDRDARPCLQDILPEECQNAPTVIKHDGIFHMIFCYRYALNFRNPERGYRLGYAKSSNLTSWIRDDKALKLEGSNLEWENQMKCYPGIIKIENKIFMFYCGNSFGETGFGVAELITN